MKVLMVGSGGREHSLVWKIAQCPEVKKVYCAPGNAGIANLAECVVIDPQDIDALKDFALKQQIDLTVVGPELPLTMGIVDGFEEAGLRIFGPSKKAAHLEGSKIFAKKLMKNFGIPTADFEIFTDPELAKKYIIEKNAPVVIKADGLAAGKGVFPSRSMDVALNAIERIMVQKEFGLAGDAIIVEELLTGEEASFICFTDGTFIMPMPSSQDHKPVFDGDNGPNTGGMGAYSPAPVITPEVQKRVMEDIMYPTVRALAEQGIKYKGVLYAGLMIENGFPRVLEFNARFGDPETQPLMLRLKTTLVDILNAVIDERLCELTSDWDPRSAVCVVMASGGYPGSYEKGYPILGLDEVSPLKDSVVFHAGTRLKDQRVLTSGGRVLGVTALGDDISNAIKNVYAEVTKIHWENVHYRMDIGKKAIER
jgi:phosphoribosylamine--glycine ligase